MLASPDLRSFLYNNPAQAHGSVSVEVAPEDDRQPDVQLRCQPFGLLPTETEEKERARVRKKKKLPQKVEEELHVFRMTLYLCVCLCVFRPSEHREKQEPQLPHCFLLSQWRV